MGLSGEGGDDPEVLARSFIGRAELVVVKVGSSVVTRSDGRLALGRLGAVVEVVENLLRRGKKVVLVTSGAVAVGRSKLQLQRLMNTSIGELHRGDSLGDLSRGGGGDSLAHTKACAAAGQAGLMGLYENLFTQLGVQAAQVLVTDFEFSIDGFRKQVQKTVGYLHSMGVVPVFNENDAISFRSDPYQDEKGKTFWDNDSLAALLAVDLRANLLLILSDIDGLYDAPPSQPGANLIRTYSRNVHGKDAGGIIIGEKSTMGRGGMTAKVESALKAMLEGVPTVVANGTRTATEILSVFEGHAVGTLFSREGEQIRDAMDAATKAQGLNLGSRRGGSLDGAPPSAMRAVALDCRDGSRALQALTTAQRVALLGRVAAALEAHEGQILSANAADVAAAIARGDLPQATLDRLVLKPGKIAQLATGIRQIAAMDEPIGRPLHRTELADGLVLTKETAPLGVLLVIFEARPDAMPQISALALRSGNGLLLKGGTEAQRTNQIMHKVITDALAPDVPAGCIGLASGRAEVGELLKLDDVIDLVIPRGSNAMVRHIQESTRIAVLGHADGVCHLYVDEAVDLDAALKVVVDSKKDYPAACNAVETVLVHRALAADGRLDALLDGLAAAGVGLHRAHPPGAAVLDTPAGRVASLPSAPALRHEWGGLNVSVRVVEGLDAAVEHIHDHGSGHTDGILTTSDAAAERFLASVDSACVFANASTRFSDGFRFGLGAEVGISTSRIHARGPVGVEGLLTTRCKLRGCNQTVDKDRGVTYTHKKLPLLG